MEKPKKPKDDKTQIIGLRLPKKLAMAIKQEAANRGMHMNALIAQIWADYEAKKKVNH